MEEEQPEERGVVVHGLRGKTPSQLSPLALQEAEAAEEEEAEEEEAGKEDHDHRPAKPVVKLPDPRGARVEGRETAMRARGGNAARAPEGTARRRPGE